MEGDSTHGASLPVFACLFIPKDLGAVPRLKHAESSVFISDGRKSTAETTGLSEAELLKFTNMADLMRIKGVGEEYSELLEAAGVDTVKELRNRRADNLTAKMAEVNEAKKLVRSLPAEKTVQGWVDHAKTLDPLVTH